MVPQSQPYLLAQIDSSKYQPSRSWKHYFADNHDGGLGDVLFDGDSNTCINTADDSWRFHYRSINFLSSMSQQATVTVTVVGWPLVCGLQNKGLHFFVNAEADTAADICLLNTEMKICEYDSRHNVTEECRFRCECNRLLPVGGCDQLYWKQQNMQPEAGITICEVEIAWMISRRGKLAHQRNTEQDLTNSC